MPQRTANPRRPCRAHERLWVSRYVDVNLEDAWLEALNALEAFELKSICEGHPRGTEAKGGPRPHIYLFCNVPLTIRDFDCRSDAMRMLLDEQFGDGRSDFKIEFNVTVGRTGTSETELWIKITAQHRRVSESMDQETLEWFETTVERIQLIDSLFLTRF